jgi:RNA polymerase primary sigma factor
MSKANDIDDLLGDAPATKAPAKKAAAKTKAEAKPAAKKVAAKTEPEAKVKAPAKKAAKVEDDILGEAPAKAKSVKAPISFAEGERQALADAVTAHFKRSKKGINSKDLAAKLETETRKLRVVLYALVAKGVVSLEPGASKVAGMTVSPA